MSRGTRALSAGWTPWSTASDSEPYSTGRMGFSLRRGGIMVDMAPVQGSRTTLTHWKAEGWTDGDRSATLFSITAPDHWRCATLVDARLSKETHK